MQRIVHETPRSICEQVPTVPRWLEGFIFKLLSKAEVDRFADAVTVASLLEHEIAHFENPAQNSKPARSALGYAESQTAIGKAPMKLLMATSVCLLCAVVWSASQWMANHASDTVPIGSRHEVASQSTESASLESSGQQYENETIEEADSLQLGPEAIRTQAKRIQHSFMGSDALPTQDHFDHELRRLKNKLDTFELQNR